MIDLKSRYNLSASPDWQALLTHFELGRGFAFIVLLIPNQDAAELCHGALGRYLEDRGLHLREVPATTPSDLRNMAGPLLDLHADAATGAIWVARAVPEAVPEFPVWRDAWREGAARLNQFRNPLRRQFEIPLIFAGAPWLQEVLREAAPDLWSVRTLVAWVEPPEILPEMPRSGPDSTPRSRGPDPELALAEANRLRRKEGAEAALARLLYRAGLGFAARYQWAEAVKAFSESLEIRRRIGAPMSDIAETELQLGRALKLATDYDRAVLVLTQARTELEAMSNTLGAADCARELGDIAVRRANPEEARRFFEEALAGYRSAGDRLGQAYCMRGLGQVALRRFDLETARNYYEKSIAFYRQMGDVLGQATCFLRLGDIANWRADYVTASAQYEEAMKGYDGLGDVLGQANSTFRLGEVAFHQSNIQTAESRFEVALTLYKNVGDALGQANCIVGLGQIAALQGDIGVARGCYHAAIELCVQIAEWYTVGTTYAFLARISAGQERDAYLEKARSAFQTIGRQDLIDSLDKEFTSPTPPADAAR